MTDVGAVLLKIGAARREALIATPDEVALAMARRKISRIAAVFPMTVGTDCPSKSGNDRRGSDAFSLFLSFVGLCAILNLR